MSTLATVTEYIARFSQMIGVPIPPPDADGFTQVARGSATIGINVLEKKGLLLFLAPIFDIDKEVPPNVRPSLYRRILELNYLETEDGAFAIDRASGKLFVRALRGLEQLDFEEFVDMLDTVARVADDWDDLLRAEFIPDSKSPSES